MRSDALGQIIATDRDGGKLPCSQKARTENRNQPDSIGTNSKKMAIHINVASFDISLEKSDCLRTHRPCQRVDQ
jgi:hypothetical protein